MVKGEQTKKTDRANNHGVQGQRNTEKKKDMNKKNRKNNIAKKEGPENEQE